MAAFPACQDCPQPSSDEAVQMAVNGRRGLLEVAEPSPKHGVEIVDDPPHARAPAAAGYGAHFVPRFRRGQALERAQALLAHQPTSGFEPVAEEVKPLPRFATVAEPRLVRMQPQAIATHAIARRRAACASCAVRHKITKSSA